MKRTVTALGLMAVILIMVSPCFAQYYYGGGRQIPLKIDATRMSIRFDADITAEDQQALLNSLDRVSGIQEDIHAIDGFVTVSLTSTDNYDEFLASVRTLDGVYLAEPYYINSLDVVLNDLAVSRALLEDYPTLRTVPHTVNSEYYGIAMRPDDSVRLGLLNDALAGIMGGYTYERLHEHWFGYPPMDIAAPDSVKARWPSD